MNQQSNFGRKMDCIWGRDNFVTVNLLSDKSVVMATNVEYVISIYNVHVLANRVYKSCHLLFPDTN